MKIAIPIINEQLSTHFGHCAQFYLYQVDEKTNEIGEVQKLTPPPHEPGVLPRWLKEMKVDIIIAGGMGQGAQQLFTQYDIKVFVGAPVKEPEELVKEYLEGNLTIGNNACDH